MPRHRTWSDLILQGSSIASGGTRKDDLGLQVDEEVRTAVRCIVGLDYFSISTSEAEYTQLIHVGIGIASQEAFDVETLPDLNTTGDYPTLGWYYAEAKILQQKLPTGGTPTAMFVQNARFDVDLHAARKVDRGRMYMQMMNVNLDGSATAIVVAGRVRTLFVTT